MSKTKTSIPQKCANVPYGWFSATKIGMRADGKGGTGGGDLTSGLPGLVRRSWDVDADHGQNQRNGRASLTVPVLNF